MAKFFELTDENQTLVNDVFQDTGMHNYMNLKMVGVSKAKELIKVSKANPLAEYVGKCPDTIVCAIYEDAFDRLDEKTKRLLLTDAFGVVSLVAMSPLITIEALGLIAIIKDKIKSKKAIKQALKNNDRVIIEFN